MQRVLLILMALSALATISSAAEDDEIFNVDVFYGWDGYYRPMEWTPIEIGISSTLTEPFGGAITVTAQQDGLNTMNVTHKFALTPDMPLHLPLVTKLAYAADKCVVTILDDRDRRQWQREYSLWDYSRNRQGLITSVAEEDLLIGLVGRGRFGLLRLPNESYSRSSRAMGKVFVGHKLARMVPWDWTGFVPLDLLVLYDPDWSQFQQQQLKAIVQWVSNGGRLMLVLGSRPLTGNNPITRFLPFELQDVRQVNITQTILQDWNLTHTEPETVSAWPVVPKADTRYYDAPTYDMDECLFATAHIGFGHVGVLAFDPSTLSERQAANSALFWTSRIRILLGDDPTQSWTERSGRPVARRVTQIASRTPRTIEYSDNPDRVINNQRRMQGRFEVGQAQVANNAVMEFLYQGIKPLSIWWVILLLTLLAILLGPLDYKLLKRKDKLPLTWITCTFWIALFTVGAYYGVQAIRGGDLELRVVSVIDGIEDDDHSWATNYCGLFAPYSDDYRLSGLQPNQWWSGIAPTLQTQWQYNREVAGRKIYCFQHDGGNVPYSLPINIWTVQCLLNEAPVEKMPFTAEVRNEGDRIDVIISNESDAPILNAYVYLGNDRGVNLGPVPAGETRQFNKKSRTMRLWDSYNLGRYQNIYSRGRQPISNFRTNDAFFAQGSLHRTRAMSDYLDRGAALLCAEYDQAPVSFTVEDHSGTSNHVQVARLVVFPK